MPEPKTASEYLDRGCDKDDKRDSKGAIEDYTKAIELDPNYAEAYANRGCAKEELGDKEGAIADWQKAADLGDEEAAEWISEIGKKIVQIHCKESYFDELLGLDLEFEYSCDEYTVVVDPIPGLTEKKLCEHYGIDYSQVNCVEYSGLLEE